MFLFYYVKYSSFIEHVTIFFIYFRWIWVYGMKFNELLKHMILEDIKLSFKRLMAFKIDMVVKDTFWEDKNKKEVDLALIIYQ